MSIRSWMWCLYAGGVWVLPGMQTLAASPPNIVIVVVDDLGYGETGAQGNREIPTPNIDSIAAGGARLTAGYVTAPFCAQSRAGLMTGRYQTRFGFERNPVGALNSEPGIGLPTSEKTIADRLKDVGYTTAAIGKWHLGGTARFHPLRRGFDEFFGFLHEGHYYSPAPYEGTIRYLRRRVLPDGRRDGVWKSADGSLFLSTHQPVEFPYDADNPILRNGQPVDEQQYLTEALSREAADFVLRHKDRPFFLYLAYNAVHSPMQARKEDLQEFRHIADPHRQVFAGMLRSLDNGVGQVLSALRTAGVEENTLIVFLSDNGGPTQELTSSNAPLRGGKGSLYEGGVRVPFFIRWDERIPPGQSLDHFVSSIDLVPTALAAAGAPIDDDKVDGVDLLPYLTRERVEPPRETLFWRMETRAALRHGDWKIVRSSSNGNADWELYHLAEDVSESQNLAGSRPEILSDLINRWTSLNAEMSAPAF